MLFLATFFPTWEGGIYDFIGVSRVKKGQGVQEWNWQPLCLLRLHSDPQEFMKASVDMADLIGLNLVMSRNAGKGEYKIMVAALGWATAELIMSRCVQQPGSQILRKDAWVPQGCWSIGAQSLSFQGVWVPEKLFLCLPQLHPSLGRSPRH